MTYQILNNNISDTEINELATHPLQSYQWGEARKKMGTDILRIGNFVNKKLTEVFTISIHKIPYTGYKIGYVPRSKMPSEVFLFFLKELKNKYNFVFIKFEPDEELGVEIPKSLTRSLHPLFPEWTQVIDLSKSQEELLKKMKPKTRYNIKVALKNNIKVKEETNQTGYNFFEKLYFETVKRQTYHGHQKKFHRIVFSEMKNGIAHLLIAKYKNTPLSAYELFLFKNKLYYPYGGSSRLHKNFMASNLLMWEAIKFGKSKGALEFDMWGSLPPDFSGSLSWSGFSKFKAGYGTRYKKFAGSFDFVLNPVLYKIYSFAYFIRNLLLKLRVF